MYCYCNIRYGVLASFHDVFITIIKVTYYCEWVLTFWTSYEAKNNYCGKKWVLLTDSLTFWGEKC